MTQADAATLLGALRSTAAATGMAEEEAAVVLQVGRLPLEDEVGEGIVEIMFARQQGQYITHARRALYMVHVFGTH